MKNRVFSTLALAAGLGLGLWSGGRFQSRDGGGSPAEGGTTIQPAISAAVRATTGPSASIQEKIDAVWKGRTPAEQMALAAAWADVRDPVAIRELLKHLHRLPANMSQVAAQSALLDNWLALEPEAALRWCRDNAEPYVSPMLESWANRDVEGAKAYALSLSNGEQLDVAAGAVLKVLAVRDSKAAFDFLGEIGQRSGISRWVEKALTTLANENPQALLARADELPTKLRLACREAAALALARHDAATALAWWAQQPDRDDFGGSFLRSLDPEAWETGLAFLANQSPGTLREYSDSIILNWGSKDPARTFALLEASRTPESRSLANEWSGRLDSLFRNWSRTDAPAAATAFLSLEKPDQAAARAIGLEFARDDPAAARAWAASISDEATRGIALKAIDGANTLEPPQAPPQTAAELVERAATDGQITRDFILGLSPEERGRMVDALAELPPGEALTATIRLLESGDGLPYATAGAMLAALRPADEAENERMLESTLSITHNWANAVPEEAARWAETLPSGSVLNSAAAQIARNWNYYDPAAARAWAESLPDESARAAALGALGR